MSSQLAEDVPTVNVVGVPHRVEATGGDPQGLGLVLPDGVRESIARANLIIVATDERRVQRGLGRLVVDLDVRAVFPGYDPDNDRGEVFVYLGARTPCFLCLDLFRDADAPVRAVGASGVDMDPVITLAVRLSLGLLDPASDYARDLRQTTRTRTLFLVGPPVARGEGIFSRGQVRRVEVARRRNCPGCAHPLPRAPAQTAPAQPQPIRLSLPDWWRTGLVATLAVSLLLLVAVLAAVAGTGTTTETTTTTEAVTVTNTTTATAPAVTSTTTTTTTATTSAPVAPASTTTTSGSDDVKMVAGIDVDAYCAKLGYRRSGLAGAEVAAGAAYDNWRCLDANGDPVFSVDMDTLCKSIYPGIPMTARPNDPNDAYTWNCYTSDGSQANMQPSY